MAYNQCATVNQPTNRHVDKRQQHTNKTKSKISWANNNNYKD